MDINVVNFNKGHTCNNTQYWYFHDSNNNPNLLQIHVPTSYNMQIVEWSQGNCGVEPGKLRSGAREIVEWSQGNCGVEPGKLWSGAREIAEWSQGNCGI